MALSQAPQSDGVPVLSGPSIAYLKARTDNDSSYPYFSTVRTSLHMMGIDGENDKVLFTGQGNCWSPVVWPAGKRTAFSFWVNGKGQILVVNQDGSHVYNASNNAFCDHSPNWSPDGAQIAFVSDRDGDWEVYLMNADGTGQRRLTFSPGIDRNPRWSPDGGHIAFESDRQGGFNIWIMNSDGSEQKALVARLGNEYEPVWSPDGKRLACTVQMVGDRRSLSVVNVEDGTASTFFQPWAIRYTRLHSISWSPDGTRIAGAFEGGRNTEDSAGSGLFVIAADGSGHREILKTEPLKPRSGGEQGGKMLGAGWYSDYSASQRWISRSFSGVSWSPDGSGITFSSDLDDSGDFHLYVLPAQGGQPVKLDGTRSAWASDLHTFTCP